ncbi:MAG TPA: glycosyltransferase family 39 protein [Chloroflexota bacterium]
MDAHPYGAVLTSAAAPSLFTRARLHARARLHYRREHLLAGLVLLGLLPRLALIFARHADFEFWEYETLAQNIASGSGYSISRFGHTVLAFGDGNLYSFLAGVLYAMFGHQPLVLGVVQAVLVSLAAPVVFAIAERSFGTRTAALGAALTALHPGLMAYTLKLHPLGLDVLLLMLLIFWGLRQPWNSGNALVTGLTLGLNLMSRPTFFVAGLAGLAATWCTRHVGVRRILLVTALGVLVAMPWIGRNWLLLGRPTLTSTSFEDVWKGNNLAATGSGMLGPGSDIFDAAPIDLRNRIWQSNELQVGDVFAQETLRFIEQQPDRFAGLVARKFVYFWWLPQQAGVLYPSIWLRAYEVYAVVVYALAVIGAAAILRGGRSDQRDFLATVVSIGLTLAVIHALAYVEGRHRWGLEPLILVLTAQGVFSLAGSLRGLTWEAQSRVFRRVSER